MDAGEIYHFLFETYTGIGILIVATLIISLVICVVLERRTRRIYQDRGPRKEGDEWSLFDDEPSDSQ